jgi:hypothetical protein
MTGIVHWTLKVGMNKDGKTLSKVATIGQTAPAAACASAASCGNDQSRSHQVSKTATDMQSADFQVAHKSDKTRKFQGSTP